MPCPPVTFCKLVSIKFLNCFNVLPKISESFLRYDSELLDRHIKTVQKLDRNELIKGNKKPLFKESLLELFAVIVKVLWCCTDSFDFYCLNVWNTDFQRFRMSWMYMKEALPIGLFSIYLGVKFVVFDLHVCIQKINSVFWSFVLTFIWVVFCV